MVNGKRNRASPTNPWHLLIAKLNGPNALILGSRDGMKSCLVAVPAARAAEAATAAAAAVAVGAAEEKVTL